MPIQKFVQFTTLNRLFADECEAISGHSGQSLKQVLNTQIRAYIGAYRNPLVESLVEVMDIDK